MYKRQIFLTCFVLIMLALPLVTHAQVENLLLNPSFEDDENIAAGPQWWTWNPAEGAGSTATIVDTEYIDGKRSLRVEPLGSSGWHFYVVQTVPLDVGTTYTYSFWAKAEAERPLTVNFKSLDNASTWELTDFQLTTEWAEYHITGSSQSEDVKLEILCAAAHVPFWLDFGNLYEGDYVAGIGPLPPMKAADPDPADGSFIEQTWATLNWTPGILADTHNVYMGDNFDDVNDGTGDTFRDNQGGEFYVAGFAGYAYPDGLVKGTTYYWRIDEVNDADPNSPWKGDVWSFTVTPETAYMPVPADGAELIDLNVRL